METIFYISDSAGATLLFGLIKVSLNTDQLIIHSHSLSTAINNIKEHHTETNTIIIADDFVNDLERTEPHKYFDFAHALQQIESNTDTDINLSKRCFLIDMACYKGNKKDFYDYCKKNNITLFDLERDDIQKFIEFIKQ